MGDPSSSQDLIEEIEEIEEVSNTIASDKNEFIFKPRVRNPKLNRLISFNIDYKNIVVEELGLNLAVKGVGLNLAEKIMKLLSVYRKY
ncbi:hypothetical protein F8M41_015877 [Gigaspora margarita]|uniref:Uncharacterized protein n=1 Tax=Gigaspora margarita TaxID=4874 RepID=A0A8H4AQ66_GIGMA|nr:hypothetical protein F8M41_015877 [Gigaspora margarita]